MQINGSALDEEPIAGDPAVFALLKTSVLNEAVSVFDAGRQANWNVQFDAPLTVVDSIVRSAFHIRNTGETIVVVDITTGQRVKPASLTEAITVVDQLVRLMNLTRQLSETLTLVDEIIGSKVKPFLMTDTLVVTDTGRNLTRDITFDGQVTLTEQLTEVINGGGGPVIINFTATDTLTITDGRITTVLRGSTLTELVTLLEGGLGKDILYNVDVVETLDISEQLLIRRMRQLVTTDGITLFDFLTSSTSGNRALTIGESIVFFDQCLTSVQRNRIDTDTLILSENTIRALQRLSTLTESVIFQDGTLKIKMWDQRVGETIALSDELQRQIVLAVLYDINIRLGVDADPILSVEDPILLGVGDPIVLGAQD